MIIGVPKEIKTNENRVALTPAGALEFSKRKHTVYVQSTAGEGSDARPRGAYPGRRGGEAVQALLGSVPRSAGGTTAQPARGAAAGCVD